MKPIGTAVLGLGVLVAASLPLAAQTTGKAWSERWKAENKQWVACHMMSVGPDRLDAAKKLIVEGLAPLGFNALVLEVDYRFQFKSHPELETSGLDEEQAGMLAELCRKHGIRLIPLMNCHGLPPRRQTGRHRQNARRAGYRLVDQPGWPAGRLEERARAVQAGEEAESRGDDARRCGHDPRRAERVAGAGEVDDRLPQMGT